MSHLRTSERLSSDVKQGCPFSPALCGLCVDGLEKHLLETASNNAPELGGILVPLTLYAEDLLLMFTSPEGFQRQSDALASFCEQRQLTLNLSKAKVVIFARKSDCKEFDLEVTQQGLDCPQCSDFETFTEVERYCPRLEAVGSACMYLADLGHVRMNDSFQTANSFCMHQHSVQEPRS